MSDQGDRAPPPKRPLSRSLRPTTRASIRATALRRGQSPVEGLLWSHLRVYARQGVKFRRQHPIGPYVADFYCHAAALVVETDGAHHSNGRKVQDSVRDRWMTDRELRVIRVPAHSVARAPAHVAHWLFRIAQQRIAEFAAAKASTPNPEAPDSSQAPSVSEAVSLPPPPPAGEVAEALRGRRGEPFATESKQRQAHPRESESLPPPPPAGEVAESSRPVGVRPSLPKVQDPTTTSSASDLAH